VTEAGLGKPIGTDVRELVHETGSFAYAEQRMQDCLAASREALARLAEVRLHEQTVGFYKGMVEFIGSRRH
jgi:hypothetical protein